MDKEMVILKKKRKKATTSTCFGGLTTGKETFEPHQKKAKAQNVNFNSREVEKKILKANKKASLEKQEDRNSVDLCSINIINLEACTPELGLGSDLRSKMDTVRLQHSFVLEHVQLGACIKS